VNAQGIYNLLIWAEVLLWLTALCAALTARIGKSYPALICLFSLRAIMTACYDGLVLYPAGTARGYNCYEVYSHIYWPLYFAAAFSTFFCIEQLLREAFSPLPGLSRLVVYVFRFTGALCLFIALTAQLPMLGKVTAVLWLQAFSISLDLCICIFEITLVSTLIFNARRLGLSLRTRTVGLSLGFLLFGASDVPALLHDILRSGHEWLEMTAETGLIAAIVLWIAYLLSPARPRGPLTLKANSTLMRWNEIVNQLGGNAPLTTQPTMSFMDEVETLVKRIMVRNSEHRL
jgi:hypothetical protein